MVNCGVFFAVRTEFLNIIQTSFGFKGLKNINIEMMTNRGKYWECRKEYEKLSETKRKRWQDKRSEFINYLARRYNINSSKHRSGSAYSRLSNFTHHLKASGKFSGNMIIH
jgi:hypothetical protein